jgi:anti-sigma regulatory factor (Ser/Thr protein kinase)
MVRARKPQEVMNRIDIKDSARDRVPDNGAGAARKSPTKLSIKVHSDGDLKDVRNKAREFAQSAGFIDQEVSFIATAASILARNILGRDPPGRIVFESVHQAPRFGMVVMAVFEGPEAPDLYVDMGNLSTGLSCVKRSMDELSIVSNTGQQTETIVMKWLKSPTEEATPHFSRSVSSMPSEINGKRVE